MKQKNNKAANINDSTKGEEPQVSEDETENGQEESIPTEADSTIEEELTDTAL